MSFSFHHRTTAAGGRLETRGVVPSKFWQKLFGASIAVPALILAGCTAASSPEASDSSSPEGEVTGQSQLVIDFFPDRQSAVADPHTMTDPGGRMVLRAVYDTLLTFTSDDFTSPEPWLAESFESNEDGTEFTFNLREGVTFSDGSELTAEDVRVSLERLRHIADSASFLMRGIEVEVVDDYTVLFRTAETRADLPAIFTNPNTGIINSKVLLQNGGVAEEGAADSDTAGADLFANQSAGSGPYVITRYEADREVVLEANPEFWGPAPSYERLVLRVAAAPIQLLNIQSGESDLVLDLSSEEVSQLDPAEFNIVESLGANILSIQFSLDPKVSPVTANADFREAFKYALDYEKLRELGGPAAQQACGIIHIQLGGLKKGDEGCLAQDLDRAKAALERSGLEDPEVTFTVRGGLARDGIDSADIAIRAAGQLAAIGIRANISVRAAPVANELRDSGQVQIFPSAWSIRYADAVSQVQTLKPGGGTSVFGENRYRTGWFSSDNPASVHEPLEGQLEIEELGDRIIATADRGERARLLDEYQRLFNETSPFIPVAQGSRAIVAQLGLDHQGYHASWVFDIPTFVGSLPAGHPGLK